TALRRLTTPVLGGNSPSITVLTTTVLNSTRLSKAPIDTRPQTLNRSGLGHGRFLRRMIFINESRVRQPLVAVRCVRSGNCRDFPAGELNRHSAGVIALVVRDVPAAPLAGSHLPRRSHGDDDRLDLIRLDLQWLP